MSALPRVFVTRRLPGPAVDRLATLASVERWDESGPCPPARLRAALETCEGIVCTLTDRIDAALLAAAPKLKVVSSVSVGVDHVDVLALNRRGIPLGHTPGVLAEATADLAFALLLAAARRLPEAERFVREGQWTPARAWEPDLLLGRELHGATLGLVGLGAVGQAMVRRAAGFGLRTIGWTPSGRWVAGVEPVSLDQLLAQADFVSLHLALTSRTRGIIGAGALARMRPDAILINTARGGLVDEAALLAALRERRLGAAALDVFEHEPIAGDHPLLALPNVLAVPHIGSATLATRSRMAALAVDNVLAGLRGEPLPHCANPEVYGTARSGTS